MLMTPNYRRLIGMRNKNRFFQSITLDFSLVIAIIISVVLTGFIFISFGKNEPLKSVNEQQAEQQSQVFRPTQYIVTKANGNQYIALTPANTQVKTIEDAITKAKFSGAETKKSTTHAIQTILSQKKSQILRYPDVVPVTYFNTRYGKTINSGKPFNFNYFVLALDQSNKGYFINTNANEVTTVNISQLNTPDVWQMAAKLPTDVGVEFHKYQGRVMLSYPKQFKLPVYSYLVNQRDPKTYVSALLGTLNQLSVTQEGSKTVYTNKLNNQKITYDPSWETVTFEDKNPKNKLPQQYVNRLNLAFSQINLLQLNLMDTRFYESQAGGQKITFRTYVKGFPVYFQSQSGAIHIELSKNGDQKSTYSLNEIGVPVPSNQADVQLPSTETILKQLHDAGVKSSDYDFITPGYEWLINQDSQAAVNMVPTWMIETPTGWQSVSAYLSKKHVNAQQD